MFSLGTVFLFLLRAFILVWFFTICFRNLMRCYRDVIFSSFNDLKEGVQMIFEKLTPFIPKQPNKVRFIDDRISGFRHGNHYVIRQVKFLYRIDNFYNLQQTQDVTHNVFALYTYTVCQYSGFLLVEVHTRFFTLDYLPEINATFNGSEYSSYKIPIGCQSNEFPVVNTTKLLL